MDTYRLLRPALFALSAETAHRLTMTALRWGHRAGVLGESADPAAAAPRRVMGIDFPNPVGLAAGLDKDATSVDALAALGFGFIEVGTLTPRPQAGNPRPRLFRLTAQRAIVNRMGFNNRGIEGGIRALRRARRRHGLVVGVNIGRNKDTAPDAAVADYVAGLRACYEAADYVAVNVSSPNTPGLRALQSGDRLGELLTTLDRERDILRADLGRRVPLAVKIAPDLTEEDLDALCAVTLASGMDGIIATNTTQCHPVLRAAAAPGRTANGAAEGKRASASWRNGPAAPGRAADGVTGGLSGAPLTARSTAVLAQVKARVGDRLALIGVGGIMSGADALAKLRAGADLVQLYTGLIYRGPALIHEVHSAIRHGEADPVRY